MPCEIIAVAASEKNDNENKIDSTQLECACAWDARRRAMDHYANVDLIRRYPLPS
ncbi:hypothetical protein KCTCHS21_21980 [Cohnella abietis]|uniref:Uncharacterized protein n=1 Tax=Cohnella abietis TaxID=2507935 RepID=A0A3T1D450_9BACL|nr:hypothetical protein KCTCHS21_21980 [Cohnella abietis]